MIEQHGCDRMEYEMVNNLIDKFTQRITSKLIRTVRKLSIFLFVLSACLLLTIKAYVFTGVFFVLLIVEFAYLTIILKKNILTIYSGVGASLVLCGNLSLWFNVSLYSIQKINGVFDPVLLIIISLIKVVCLVTGFFYTLRCVRKGTVRKLQTAAIASTAFVLPGALGYFLSKYISIESSVQTQNIFFTIVFALASSMMMFIIGMAHVAILYYIKKYNITDRAISKTEEVP